MSNLDMFESTYEHINTFVYSCITMRTTLKIGLKPCLKIHKIIYAKVCLWYYIENR